jgi:hypothetical protein
MHGAASSESVDYEYPGSPVDRDDARDFFSGRMTIEVHLPIAMLVEKRSLYDRAPLHTHLDLPTRDVALLRPAPPVRNNDDVTRISRDQPHDFERERRR